MGSGNGGDIRNRLDELEKMDKLLLRAQVLQQDALETLQKTIERHQKSIAAHDAWVKDAAERDAKLDRRIEALVGAIGAPLGKMDGRGGAETK